MAGPFLVSLNSNLLPLFSLSIDCFTRGKRTPSFAIRRPSFQLDCATSQHWWPKLLTCKSDVGAGLMLWRYIEQQIHLMRDLKTHSGDTSKRMQIRCWRWIEVVEVDQQISQIGRWRPRSLLLSRSPSVSQPSSGNSNNILTSTKQIKLTYKYYY